MLSTSILSVVLLIESLFFEPLQMKSQLTNWLPGEPNSQAGEDCVQVVGAAYKDLSGSWNDNSCGKRIDCICQKSASKFNTEQSWFYGLSEV